MIDIEKILKESGLKGVDDAIISLVPEIYEGLVLTDAVSKDVASKDIDRETLVTTISYQYKALLLRAIEVLKDSRRNQYYMENKN